jgi:hypothetical protein
MSSISKRLSLRVPANIIYRGLKDTRLERLFPEFFAGVIRRLTTTNNKANSELQFTTTTYDFIIGRLKQRVVPPFPLPL